MLRILLLLLTPLLAVVAEPAELALEDCRISAGPGMPSMPARCGTFARPLDPAGGVDGEIRLRVAVVPALNLTPEPDAFVPIAGGPGQGSVQFYASYSHAFEPVRRNRDILLVDQRGTGESATMDCEFDDDFLDGNYSAETTRQYTEQCLDELPWDARFFTTSVAVADLDAIREALGYPALNVYGVSYGSRVAQHYARRFPHKTRTVILDGVVPPQKALGPEIATESQKAVDRILSRCIEDTQCNERFPNIDATFETVLAQLIEAPRELTVPHPSTGRPESMTFGRNEFAIAVRLLAYNPRSIALLPLLLHEAGTEHFVPLASQFAMTMVSLSDAIAIGMHNSVMCSEDLPFIDDAEIDRAALEASYLGPLQLDALKVICSVWPSGPVDDDFKTPLATDLPVLLLSGDADPITPPAYAELAMAEMSNARHLIGRDQGHGMAGVGCMPDIVAEFVDGADVASLETECLERAFVMPFFLDFSGPAP